MRLRLVRYQVLSQRKIIGIYPDDYIFQWLKGGHRLRRKPN
jgi:hypothetical protein